MGELRPPGERVKIEITLPPKLYRELLEAAAVANCLGDDNQISAARFAQEAVESVLASRRLEKLSRAVCA